MSMKARLLVIIGLSLVGCSPSGGAPDRVQETRAAEPAAAAPGRDMAGMPGMPSDSGTMPPMAGMDHAQMTTLPAGEIPAPRPGLAPTSANPITPTMPGMDHAAMAGMQMAPSELDQPGSDQLLTLISELVRDPIVRRAIEADPALREVWADTSVTRTILRPR